MADKPHGAWLDEWEADFKGHGESFKRGPVENRECRDICCLVFFFILFGVFLGIGGWCIAAYNGYVSALSGVNVTIELPGMTTQTKGAFAGTVVGMVFFSIVLSIGFVLLTKAFPKCMVYGLIVFSVLLLLAVAAAGFAIQSWILGGVFVGVALIYGLILFCCLRGHIETSIVLVKCTANFLSEKPQIYLVSVLMTIMTILFSVYWIFSYISITNLSFSLPANSQIWSAFTATLWVLYVFFTYFFYYSMVFLIAASVAQWYYGNLSSSQSSMLGTAFKWYFKSAVGPITFASVVITVIKIIKSMVNENSSNPVLRLCFCIIKCIFAALEYIIKIMNHYAVIGMAFTGENYFTSAKRAGVLIFSNLGLFATVDIIQAFFFYVSLLICMGIPTAVGAIITVQNIIPLYTFNDALLYGQTLLFYMIAIVLILSLICSIIFVSTFTEALGAVFVFFCMDKELAKLGIAQHNAPDGLKQLLEELAFTQSNDGPSQVQLNQQTMEGGQTYGTYDNGNGNGSGQQVFPAKV